MVTDTQQITDNTLVGIRSDTGNPAIYVKATHNKSGQPISDSDVDGLDCIKAGLGEYYIVSSPAGGGPFSGSRNITRVGLPGQNTNVGGNNIVDFLNNYFFPAIAPGISFSVNSPNREVGASTAYTLTWSVTKNTNPITAITVDGVSITPTGNSQAGTQNGNVATAAGSYAKNMSVVASAQTGDNNAAGLAISFYFAEFWDTVASVPANSAQVRALGNTQLTAAGNQFTINTGTVNKDFVFALPPGKAVVSVIDQDALNLNITSLYISSFITVNDAGGNPQTYTLYHYSQSVPYGSNHRHLVTTN